MTHPVVTIARWEFLRFAKTRDLVVGALVFAAMFGAGSGFGEFVAGKAAEPKQIAVAGAVELGDASPDGRFVWTPVAADAVDSLLAAEAVDAALVESAPGVWDLRAARERSWFGGLKATFASQVGMQRLLAAGLDDAQRAALTTPVEVRTRVIASDADEGGPTDAFTAGIATAVMLMGLFVGFSFVFVAITAEKTQRTTESILSAVTPQQWIDGKIVGLTGAVVVNLLSTAIGYLLWQAASVVLLDGSMSLPGGATPVEVVGLVVFSVVGFAFWFTLFAMVAATIDDPNSSSRSSLMFLPFLLLGPAFLGLDQPDAVWMRVLALVPGTSPAAMPVRFLRGEPMLWEIVLSLTLLAAAAWGFRRMAGRIFGTSMLMTGKEPGLREIFRWLREA